jgi:uncharacterized protein
MKRGFIYIALAGALLLVCVYLYGVLTVRLVPPTPSVRIGNQIVHVTIVETPQERHQGLSGRAGLEQNEGMLFVFPEDGKYGFWMKDMLFSIDILWISADGTIVDMKENVSPDTYPQSFAPAAQARYVLELPAGHAVSHSVRVGDRVEL